MKTYSFKVIGAERKVIAQIITTATNQAATYAGPPSFAYKIGTIVIDRGGMITAPIDDALANILRSLKESKVIPEGHATITIPMGDHTGVSLRNLVNSIYSKDALLQKALDKKEPLLPAKLLEIINAVRLEETEDFKECIMEAGTGGLKFDFEDKTISFNFYNATMEIDEVKTYLAFSTLLEAQAIKQKYTSFIQKVVENDKYAMRCWLLRLGMIGAEYKIERKILLERLTGNCSFKTEESLQTAIAKRKTEESIH